MQSVDWEIIGKYLNEMCSDQEKKEIEARIKSDADFAKLMKEMRFIWKSASEKQLPFNSQVAYLRMKKRILQHVTAGKTAQSAKVHNHRRRRNETTVLQNILRYAAVLILFVAAGMYLKTNILNDVEIPVDSVYKEFMVQSGQRIELKMQDGTKIKLDARSRIRYPKNFEIDKREVFLEGEGFFTVARDENRPFIVHAINADIEVLGTEFNIEAWSEENMVSVAVKDGKVALRPKDTSDEQGVILTKGYKSSLDRDSVISEPAKTDIDAALSWMRSEMIFNDVALQKVIFKLERWFDINIEVTDSGILKRRLTASFGNESLDDILTAVSLSLKVHCERDGDSVTISPAEDVIGK